MSAQNTLALISEADYLEGEKQSQTRHEYVSGRIFAMSGASRTHNRIAGNLLAWLKAKAENTPCEVYISDVKLRIAHRQTYYYPDIILGCNPQDDNDYYLESPCMIIEILSASTKHIDRREKLLAYQSIAGLHAYVIVAQEEYRIEIHTPIDNGQWREVIYTDPAESLHLPCVDGDITVAEVYAGVSPKGRKTKI